MDTQLFQLVVETLIGSLVPCLGGLLVGGSLGFMSYRISEWIESEQPRARRFWTLLPWRTLALGMYFLLIPYAWNELHAYGISGLLFAIFGFALVPYLLERNTTWPKIRVMMISWARTLAIASVGFSTVSSSLTGLGGGGTLWWRGLRLNDAEMLRQGFWIMVGVSLVVDVLLGIIQHSERSDHMIDA